MNKLIAYPSTDNFKTFYKSIKSKVEFSGIDSEGNKIFNDCNKKPIIDIVGTVKLHGTNASIVLSPNKDLYTQSRNRVLSINDDNVGFANYVKTNEADILNLVTYIHIDNTYTILYGEWIGKGINKGCAIHNIEDKIFVIFAVRRCYIDTQTDKWLSLKDFENIKNHSIGIYNINDFEKFSITLDLNDYEGSFEKLSQLLTIVENECPVGKYFGYTGIGEGLVFNGYYNNEVVKFKFKGEKHSEAGNKSKQPNTKNMQDANYEVAKLCTPNWRLEQGLVEIFDLLNGGNINTKDVGKYIKWVVDDINKEEQSILTEYNIGIKDISKSVSLIAKDYIFNKI